ncbi:flagellar biosynthetic protein FliO, partial [Rhodobium orientis]
MSDWLMETFGMSAGWARGIQVVIAFVIVFALLAAFLWIMRRLTRTGFGHGGRTRQPRLAIMDQAHIDTRRRLVLVRRDNVEHLVLVGGPSDVVVEQNIVRGQSMAPGMRAPYPAVAQPMPAASVAPAAPQPPAAQGPVGPVAAAAVAVAAATDDEMPE